MNNIPKNAIKVFKFVTEDFLSPGWHGKIDYSGPYPKTITEENCAPKEAGQCAKGIHVILMIHIKDAEYSNVTFDKNIIAGYVMPDDVVYSEGNGEMRVRQFTVTHIPDRETIVPFFVGKAWLAYMYAYKTDRRSSDDTRRAALEEAKFSYLYALNIDKAPSDDTREAACKISQYPYKARGKTTQCSLTPQEKN